MKRAVILFNLGGPDAPSSVRPFLFNLFNDPAIIEYPAPIRWLLAQIISRARAKTAEAIYAQLGGRSPLLDLTRAQAKALEGELNRPGQPDGGVIHRVFIAMRYWHPRAGQTAAEVAAFQPDEIVLLPLYPQYSTTTTGSSIAEWMEAIGRWSLPAHTHTIRSYPADPAFAAAQAELLTETFAQAESESAGAPIRILFSAHGLPQKIVAAGDPYQVEVEQSAIAIARAAGLAQPDQKMADWTICYQSKVGPMKWLEPSLDQELARAAADKVGVVILPIAFVSEHSETLVELDIEYRHRAEALGVHPYLRVPAVGTHPTFIAGLADLVRGSIPPVPGPISNMETTA
jgi:ferrochelatase